MTHRFKVKTTIFGSVHSIHKHVVIDLVHYVVTSVEDLILMVGLVSVVHDCSRSSPACKDELSSCDVSHCVCIPKLKEVSTFNCVGNGSVQNHDGDIS